MPASCAVPAAPSRAKPTGCAAAPHETPDVPPLEPTPFQPVSPGPGLVSLPASDSGLAPQLTLMVDACAKSVLFQPAMACFTRPDSSAKPGARNEVPQAPLKVRPRSSETSQLKATLGLLVPPILPLYWSCRQDPSSSNLRIPGRALASPMIGTFSWANVAQTCLCPTSLRLGAERFAAAVLS